MAKIKRRLLSRYNFLIKGMLSVLGFGAACGLSSCEYGAPVVEYGVPHATFIVKGTVKSVDNSTALPDIQVVMDYDTNYTDQEGNYRMETSAFPEDHTFSIEFKDIDGTTNGEFQSLDTIAEFDNPQFSGGPDGWYSGETEKELNVKLKPKE